MWLTLALCLFAQEPEASVRSPIDSETVRQSGQLIGIDFTDEEIELMLGEVREHLAGYAALREHPLENGVHPALEFSPLLPRMNPLAIARTEFDLAPRGKPDRPDDLEKLAFEDIPTLAWRIRTRQITCVELTEMYLARLERLDAKLHCVITLTRERALAQARALDVELEAGEYRGILHGIPWGAKDLFATKGVRTTWGAKPFEDQVLDYDATVVSLLDEAGAVLIAKLSLGALAWGDVWFGAKTRNPWNPERGSSGSSAGSASATAAGCVVFAIGTETLGSIISPSEACGNSSLRPTFGSVSRHGAMALSWSMDKIGPICRSARDAQVVFSAIRRGDGMRDPSHVDFLHELPMKTTSNPVVEGLRVGVPKGAFEGRGERYKSVLDDLEKLGAKLIEVELPSDFPVGEMMIILSAEAAAAFDQITRDGRDDQLVRQVKDAWPNVFRAARLIPAVEYIQAQRLRTQLMRAMDDVMKEVDLLVHPSFASGILSITNLTGHPTFVAPAGFREDGRPYGISFTGQLYDEAGLLSVAAAWQEVTDHHSKHPELED